MIKEEIKNLFLFSICLKSYLTINIITSGLFVSFITKVQDTSKVQRQLREILFGNATVIKADFSNFNRKNSNSNCLPGHVFLDAKYYFFIPVDRALRVLLEIIKSAKIDYYMQTKVFSNLELHTFTLSKSGTNLHFIFLLIFCSSLFVNFMSYTITRVVVAMGVVFKTDSGTFP
jgi:hypothetical protein